MMAFPIALWRCEVVQGKKNSGVSNLCSEGVKAEVGSNHKLLGS